MERFEIAALLAWADAPAEVRAWAEGEPLCRVALEDVKDAMSLLERAPSVSAAVWTAAALTVPLDLVAAACAVVVETEAASLGSSEGGANEVLEKAVALVLDTLAGSFEPDALLEMAARCEALGSDTAGYRGDAGRLTEVGKAAGACCRAVEAAGAARQRIAFERSSTARNRAALLGIGGVLAAAGVDYGTVVAEPEHPLVLARPATGELRAPHDVRACAGLLADTLTLLAAGHDDQRIRHAFLDALSEE